MSPDYFLAPPSKRPADKRAALHRAHRRQAIVHLVLDAFDRSGVPDDHPARKLVPELADVMDDAFDTDDDDLARRIEQSLASRERGL